MSLQQSFEPPTTPLKTATAIPDQEPQLKISRWGREYGTHLEIGFRQLSEVNMGLEMGEGIAVEISFARYGKRDNAVTALTNDLKAANLEIDIHKTVPDFIQVPNPTDTVLFLVPKNGIPTADIMLAIDQFFKPNLRVVPQDSAPSDLRQYEMAQTPRPTQATDTTEQIFANQVVAAIRENPLFKKWTNTDWLLIEIAAQAALIRYRDDMPKALEEFNHRLSSNARHLRLDWEKGCALTKAFHTAVASRFTVAELASAL